jgi:hypothetical protein
MRKLSDLIKFNKSPKKTALDEKSLFYFFNKIIEREYGSKGLFNLKPDFLKNKKIFVKAKSSVWANELWLNRGEIIEKINQEIGSKEVDEISIKNN